MNQRVSIVMPAYQAERFIGAAVSSVLWQTYPNLELVVVDDGSTDATAEIVEAHKGPIRLVRQENRGVGAARNAGVAASTGELVTYCDADDILLPRHVEALVATLESSDGGLATTNSYWLLPGGIHPSKMRYKGRFPAPQMQRRAILEQNFVSTMTLFHRTLVDEIGGMDESRRLAEDWDFWLRAIFAGRRVVLQREPLSLYRWGEESLSADWQAMDADIEHFFDDLEHRVDLTDEERDYVRRRRAGPGPEKLGRQGDEALRAGRYAEAARSYREAAGLCPSERMLLWKARVLRPAPRLLGPLVRSRQLRIEKQLGIGPKHKR